MGQRPSDVGGRQGRLSRAWTAARTRPVVTVFVCVALVVVGVLVYQYGITKKPGPLPPLPFTGPVPEIYKGWWARPIAFVGWAAAALGALTGLVVSVDRLIMAIKHLWRDVRPARAKARPATKRPAHKRAADIDLRAGKDPSHDRAPHSSSRKDGADSG